MRDSSGQSSQHSNKTVIRLWLVNLILEYDWKVQILQNKYTGSAYNQTK